METTPVGSVAFPGPGVLDKRLGEFLDLRGVARDALLKEADQGHGTPALAVVAGSVLAGFGNVRSDLDLVVLVESENVTRFPVPSREHGVTIDVSTRRASKVKANTDELAAQDFPRFASVTEDAWNHRRRALNTASRLALGLPIVVSEPWETWHDSLRQPWLQDAVRQWYAVEAQRLAQAARWLRVPNPPVAALRAKEAVIAALNARAAAHGELYFAAKWAGEKLKASGDAYGLGLLREALTPGDPATKIDRGLAVVEEIAGTPDGLHAVLRWATGAGATELTDRTVVDRWQLRAVEVMKRGLPAAGSDAVLWSGPAGTDLPAELAPLFTDNMVWLGVARPDAEATA